MHSGLKGFVLYDMMRLHGRDAENKWFWWFDNAILQTELHIMN